MSVNIKSQQTMNYLGSPDYQLSSGLLKKAIPALFAALLFMASATTAFCQSPEVRKAFRYNEIEQPSKMIPALEQAAQAAPENLYYLGLGYILAGDLNKALATFEKGISADSKDPLPVAGKGHVKLLQKNASEAKTLLTQAAEMGGRKKTAAQWEAIGRAYMADSKFLLDAIAAFDKAKAIDNADREVHVLLGDAYLMQNASQGGPAVSSYERAASADPKWALPLYKIAKVYQRSQNESLMIEYLNKSVAADPEFAPAWEDLADFYYLKKEPAKALDAMKKYLAITESPGEAKFKLAFFYVMNKDYENANTIFREVLNTNNASPTALKYYGRSLLEQKKYDEAKPVFERYFSVAKPGDIQTQDYAAYGKLLLELKQDSLANEAFAKGIALDTAKQDFELMDLQAETYRKRQRFEKAAAAYEQLVNAKQAAEVRPSSYDLFWWGWSNYYAQNFTQADSAFTKLTEQQPESSLGFVWAAKARVQIDSTGEAGTAVPMYEKYLELALGNPENLQKPTEKKNIIEAYDYLGQYALHRKNDIAAATSYFKKILAIDPKNQRAQEFMEALREVNSPTRGKGR